MLTFHGCPRKAGCAGIRNVVLIISGDLCCNPWSKEIAAPYDSCFALLHKHGVGNYAPDRILFKHLITGITVNPNVCGIVFISSGNEDHAPEELLDDAVHAGLPYFIVSAKHEISGADVVRKGRGFAERLDRFARRLKPEPIPLDRLIIGLNCAGTDTISAKTVHPVCGTLADRIVDMGGTVVFSETPDLIGLGDTFFGRCERREDRKLLTDFYDAGKSLLAATGEKIDDIEMVAFNTDGGLRTLRQKAEVSILKAGSSRIKEVVSYGSRPSRKGLVFMDGPAMTDFVMTGYMAAGVHLMINTCGAGEGNKMPFTVGADTPSPILPVLKMTGSTAHYRKLSNRIDFDAAGVHAGKETVDQAADRLLGLIIEIASGKLTRTEHPQDYLLNIPVRFHQA